MTIKKKVSFVFIGLILALLFCTGVILRANAVYDYQTYTNLELHPKIDAIVCLAGARGRIEYATRLWESYYDASRSDSYVEVPHLYITGMGKKSTWNVYLSQLPADLIEKIGQENVILENESENTRENALAVKLAAERFGWKRILLVTSSYHMRRARYLFKTELGDQIQVLSAALESEPFTKQSWLSSGESIRITLIEFAKIILQKASI